MRSFLFENRLVIFIVWTIVTGIGVVIIFYNWQVERNPAVQVVEVDKHTDSEQSIFKVDVSGSVVSPGVYEVESGSRIDDLISKAGGLSAEADLEWVQKNLNKAAKVSDGQKIFIPSRNENQNSQLIDDQLSVSGKVNINTASQSELEALVGIGEATAKKIILNRPYSSLEQLVEKKVLTGKMFEALQLQLSLW